ncbi:MAG: TetR/AcrR family transcriptional regulator [Rickettsiales bacterium]
MPRIREFDPDIALADAMQVFWRNGYADTSMEDIVSETGVSRYGLYGTFGNKKELLVAAIRHYELTMGELLMGNLRRPDADVSDIVGYWRTISAYAEDKKFCDGCLIVNVAAEVAPHDADIAAEVQRIDREHTGFFANAIRNSQSKGEVSTAIDADGMGLLMVSLARGLALMSRAGTKPGKLFPAVDAALKALCGPNYRG